MGSIKNTNVDYLNYIKSKNNMLTDTEKQKIIAEIIDILSYQQVITNQGINYTGEKDWALNKILALLDKTIKEAYEKGKKDVLENKLCDGKHPKGGCLLEKIQEAVKSKLEAVEGDLVSLLEGVEYVDDRIKSKDISIIINRYK